MKQVRCNLCRDDDPGTLFYKDGYRMVRCKSCGLVYVSPRDDVHRIIRLYRRPYFELEKFARKYRTGYRNYAADRELHTEYFRKKVREILRHASFGRLLDVGTAFGYFLEEARQAGFDGWGIDVSEYAATEARKRFGKRILKGTLKDAELPLGSFEVVTAFQTLEHLPDPLENLKRMNAMLVPGGMVMLVVPDQGSWIATALGRHWFGYKPKEHLYCFTARTIIRMLDTAGFVRISASRDTARPYPVRHILERLRYLYPRISGLTSAIDAGARQLGALDLAIPVLLGDLSVIAYKRSEER